MLGRAPEASLPVVPLSLGGNVAYGPAGASVDKLAGFVQGRALSGKLDIRDKDGITGEIDIASLSLTELLGAALGPLALSGADEAGWPSGPAGPGLFEGLNGRVAVKAGALELTTGYVAGSAAFTLALSRNEFAVQDARAVLAGGELKGNLAVRRTDAEASVAARFALTGAIAPRSRLDIGTTGGGRYARRHRRHAGQRHHAIPHPRKPRRKRQRDLARRSPCRA